jgi:hypothetical protein
VASDASPGPAAGATNGSILRVFVLRKHGWLPLQDQALPRAGPAYSGGRVEAEGSVRLESLGRCPVPSPLVPGGFFVTFFLAAPIALPSRHRRLETEREVYLPLKVGFQGA